MSSLKDIASSKLLRILLVTKKSIRNFNNSRQASTALPHFLKTYIYRENIFSVKGSLETAFSNISGILWQLGTQSNIKGQVSTFFSHILSFIAIKDIHYCRMIKINSVSHITIRNIF